MSRGLQSARFLAVQLAGFDQPARKIFWALFSGMASRRDFWRQVELSKERPSDWTSPVAACKPIFIEPSERRMKLSLTGNLIPIAIVGSIDFHDPIRAFARCQVVVNASLIGDMDQFLAFAAEVVFGSNTARYRNGSYSSRTLALEAASQLDRPIIVARR
jgi:hypothetical protein